MQTPEQQPINEQNNESYRLGKFELHNRPFTLEDIQQTSQEWTEAGLCRGPTIVGNFIPSETFGQEVAQILSALGGNHLPFSDVDDLIADGKIGDSELQALSRLHQSFYELIKNDLQTSLGAEYYPYIHTYIGVEDPNNVEVPHIDGEDDSEQMVAYVTTIAGSTTQFFVGDSFGPEYFHNNQLRDDITIPDTVRLESLQLGEVARSYGSCDPHKSPDADSEARIFMIGLANLAKPIDRPR